MIFPGNGWLATPLKMLYTKYTRND